MDEFNTKDTASIMFLSLKAGGVGLNLTGANHIFLFDTHWNPSLEAQVCDRIYRVGQDRAVTVHMFLCENTVEERILKLQVRLNFRLLLTNLILFYFYTCLRVYIRHRSGL